MATRKQKKTVKVRDLKPSKDAKGGARALAAKPLGSPKSNLSTNVSRN